MKDINQIRRHLEFEISQLPQYPYLKQENIDRWIDDVIKLDPSRAIWHVDRLFRIGGSEIGPLLQSHRNKLADTISEQKYSHSSEIDIFRLKLLIDSPAPPNAAMRRGTRFEPILNEVKREELQKKYTLVRERPDLVERIVNANLPDFNWARVQVDQIWEVDGKIILLDYKFPSEGGLKTLLYEEPLMYSTQCTIGKMIANRLGIEIDEVMVSPYNMTTDSFDDINVPFDSEFEAEILHVGQAAYNKYTKGLFPTPPIPKYQIQSSEEIPNDIKEAMVKASLLRIMSKEVAESIIKEEDIYQDYLKVLSKGQSDDIRIEVATSNITGKTKKNFKKEEAVLVLKENGMPEAEVMLIKNNITKLNAALKECGVPKEEVNARCYSLDYEVDISQSRAKKGIQHQLVQAAKLQISENVSEILEQYSSDMLDYDSLNNTDGSLDKRKHYQLKTLLNLIENSDLVEVQEKAKSKLAEREVAYGAKPKTSSKVSNQSESPELTSANSIITSEQIDKFGLEGLLSPNEQTITSREEPDALNTEVELENDQLKQISHLFSINM